jgi:hypothetical protein
MKVLPVVQARQIADLLDDLRAQGEIRDAKDYEEALRELSLLVNAEDPQPIFVQLRALIWHLCRSDAHNAMMTAAKNDIEAVFLQTDEIGVRLDDQHFFFMQNVINNVEQVLNEQEDRIKHLKLLASPDNEFQHIAVNSFAQTSLHKLERSQSGAELLFFDNRTGRALTEGDMPTAYVSEHGKKIILPSTNEPKVLPVTAKLLTDDESYGTTVQATVNNNISNVIDGTQGTFWTRTAYIDTPVSRMSTVLEFDFGTGKDINYCIVEGAGVAPFFITEMWGVSLDGHKIDLMLRRAFVSADLEDEVAVLDNEIKVEGWERIDFEQVFVRGVTIKFTYVSMEEADYHTTDQTDLFNLTNEDLQVVDLSNNDVAAASRQLLASSELADICNVPEAVTQHINSSAYVFALDNVWFGNSLYSDAAIFVSTPLSLEKPGVLSMKTQEANVGAFYPEGVTTISADGQNAGSVEYEVVRQITSGEGTVQDHFPVPFLGQQHVVRERLLLTHKEGTSTLIEDIGMLRFCPRINPNVSFSIYRNDELMPVSWSPGGYVVAYSKDTLGNFEWTDDMDSTSIVDFRNWTLAPQKLWVRVIKPSKNDVYTVSYEIRTDALTDYDLSSLSTSLTVDEARVYMDANKTAYMGEEGRVVFIPDPGTGLTQSCSAYLQITLRRNSAHYALSPEVHEYALLIAPFQEGISNG